MCRPIAGKENSKPRTKAYSIPWSFVDQRDISGFENYHDSNKLKPGYGGFVKEFLKTNLQITCKLKPAGGKPQKGGLFTLRFRCLIKSCTRQYKLTQIVCNNFKIHHNNVAINHVADQNKAVKQQESVKDYLLLSTFPLNEKLNKLIDLPNNSPDVVSENTENFGADKECIFKLLNAKIEADNKNKKQYKSDVFIRRFSLDPFVVFAFSNNQLQCLKLYFNQSDNISVNFVVTKSLITYSEEYLFYYACVVPIDNKETTESIPLMEFVAKDELEEFDVKMLVSEFTNELNKKYPAIGWPIKNCVVDFNFNFLNGICQGWNKMSLITYINHTYSMASELLSIDNLKEYGITTWLQFDVGDLCKEHTNDIRQYFPNMDSKHQGILKNIFAGMCHVSDMNVLRNIWRDLSAIVLNKYLNQKVDTALKSLTMIAVEDIEDEDMRFDYAKLPSDIYQYEGIYQQSLFYQHFNSITYRKTIELTVGSTNPFHSEEYTDMFLKKYVSIISLWTCLTNHYGSKKYGMEFLKNTATEINQLESMPIDVAEFFTRMAPCRTETIAAVIETIAEKQEKQPEEQLKIKRNSNEKFKNKLFKDSNVYFAPKVNFIVASTIKLLLTNEDYKTLQSTTPLSDRLLEYVFAIFEKGESKVQFETKKTSAIIGNIDGKNPAFKINKEIMIGALARENHFTMVIINIKQRFFSYIDPNNDNPPETETFYNNFKDFIVLHNKVFSRNRIPSENWKIKRVQHQIDCEENNSAVCVIYFAKQYLKSKEIGVCFKPSEYRVHIQQLILQYSDNMETKCIICGLKVLRRNHSIECKSCNRLAHLSCLLEGDANDSINHICIICKEKVDSFEETTL